MAPTFVRRPVHRWQHLFIPLLYCLLLVRHSLKEFAYYLAPRPHLDVRHARPPTFSERVRFVLTIIVGHYGLRLAVPLLLLSPGRAWSIFWLSEVVASGYLYTTFAVNHLFAGAAYPTQLGDQDWALLVLQTTLDYACTSAWTGLLSGWLNCQVAHHLFPLVASEHLPAVSEIVRETAREVGCPYHRSPSFFAAWKIQHLQLCSARAARIDGENPNFTPSPPACEHTSA